MAAAQAALIRTQTARLAPALAKKGWKFLGPKNVGGQLEAKGVWVDPKRQDEVNGRFAWIKDGEGNRVELWEPS